MYHNNIFNAFMLLCQKIAHMPQKLFASVFSMLLFFSVSAQHKAINDLAPKGSVVKSDFSAVPCFVEQYALSAEKQSVKPILSDIVVVEIADSVLDPDVLEALGNEFRVFSHSEIIKHQSHLRIFIEAYRKNPLTGTTEHLMSYKLKFENQGVISLDNIPSKKLWAASSVLATGEWYQLSVSQSGIQKVTFEDIQEWGIDATSINPAGIRLFGNGSHMLPENNGSTKDDDLIENAILVVDGGDGTFDAGDYFLFYAEGMQYWVPESGGSFYHEVNLYSDKNYYFLTFGNDPGLRMATLNSVSDAATVQVDRFLDFTFYELNQSNLIKSGKNWFGDLFESVSLSRNYSFTFSNILTDSIVTIKAGVAGRASTATSFTLSSGSATTSVSIPSTSGYTGDFAKYGVGILTFNPTTNVVPLSIQYNQSGNTVAQGWLDYIEVFAWRSLSFAGNQMNFRNPDIAGSGVIAEYTLSGASSAMQIWDISNPIRPMQVATTLMATDLVFRIPNDTLKQFIAFNGALFQSPVFEGEVENQNLHALPQTDYLIVSHPLFRSQSEQIGQLHESLEGYSYVVVTPQQVYNEFSSGKQDPSAIRNFVKMFYDRSSGPDDAPRFLLLMGDASYDYKSRLADNNNLVPTFESLNSLSPTSSYASDDFFGLLDDTEGADCFGALDIAVGRFPVNSSQEADAIVAKLLRYTSQQRLATGDNSCSSGSCLVSNFADWRNQICFVADDGDGNLHFDQADNMADRIDNDVDFLNIDKVYLDAYNQESTTGGERCPEVNTAIAQRVEKGALIMNYTGHGGEVGWALERILDVPTIQGWTNACNMPVFITATCEFSRFDDPARTSAGEYVILNASGGGIALLTTTRLAYANYNEALNNSFYDIAFDRSSGRYPTLGELTAFSKTDNGSVSYLRNFMLIGDPALTMTVPENQVVTSTINGVNATSFNDTISALSYVTVTGYVADPGGVKLSSFNGTIYPTVYDKAIELSTLANNPAENHVAPFMLQKGIVYKGKASVTNGDFSFSFLVPKDIQYNYGNGRISYYAENGSDDASGWFENFIIGGSSDTLLNDNEGPEIRLFMNNEQFVSGGTTNEDPVVLALLSDESGINTVGTGIGHDITATLDGDNAGSVVLNDYYEAALNSYQEGTARYPYKSLSEGIHTLTLKAWDILNNSSQATIDFIVASSLELSISHVLNYPNPFTTYTEFWFEHNQPCCGLEVQIQIFSVAGRLVKTINTSVNTYGFRAEPVVWDGKDDFGSPLARGVYVYRLRVKNSDGQYTEKSEKLVILR